ncbi:hypothetical protein [Oceanobacter mangrovi]|uniref:hypothetical protein n=1 Tax=Oceanobacter mangrovi TaxID=2862510 RepID=UPI001C8DE162|nr:hypothetical protein [Oceanobacter mangrovi]
MTTATAIQTDSDVTARVQQVQHWLEQQTLSPPEVDCATAVMLKILDGKCKMVEAEKPIMAELYQQVRELAGVHLGDDIHQRIAAALRLQQLAELDEAIRMEIYETRVLAETAISRPVMKGFKARLRKTGLLPPKTSAE